MKLIGSHTSPFVRKIRVQLAEKALPYDFVEDVPWNADSCTPQYNPLGKVPVLIDDQGRFWHDSPVIAEFIETLPASPALMPAAAEAAVCVRQIEALADGITEAGVTIFLERRRPESQQSPEWMARQSDKIVRGLAELDSLLGERSEGSDWLFGETMTLADLAVGVCLAWLRFRLPETTNPAMTARLETWLAGLEARDSFRETQPPSP